MDEYLIRFVQVHDSFRLPELHALADYHGVRLEVVRYEDNSPFAIFRLPSPEAAALLVSRSILVLSISKLWGHADTYDELHHELKTRTSHLWAPYQHSPFRFNVDTFQARHSHDVKTRLINSFSYLDFQGPVSPFGDSVPTFTISENHDHAPSKTTTTTTTTTTPPRPKHVYLSVSLPIPTPTSRPAVSTYTLKLRRYISTTSMDAELALLTANLAHAGPGRVLYDPCCGTGSLLVAAAHFGALVLGSDLDGRTVRGAVSDCRSPVTHLNRKLDRERRGRAQGMVHGAAQAGGGGGAAERGVRGNLGQYGLGGKWLDGFVSDLTNSPVRFRGQAARWIDGIVCDPPYGVREGLKVLGSHKPGSQEVVMRDGKPAHLAPGYVPPKKAYSFDAMLSDILVFAAETLVDGGRLCIWIPAENPDEEGEEVEGTEAEGEDEGQKQQQQKQQKQRDLGVPLHPCLDLSSVSSQHFNKWSRRLVVYVRRADERVDQDALRQYMELRRTGGNNNNNNNNNKAEKGTGADQLNEFRRRYFQGFEARSSTTGG